MRRADVDKLRDVLALLFFVIVLYAVLVIGAAAGL